MATIILPTPARVYDLSGFSLPGAHLRAYNSGTTTPRTVYSDPECRFPHPIPLIADGAGVFPPIYDNDDRDLRITVTDENGVVLPGYPIDPVAKVTTDLTGASLVQFNPSEDIPETNVQAAIERVQQNIVEPLLDYGLGVTGNAPLLSNIDATNIPSGFYCFDATTSGSFPGGVSAETGGMVHLLRASSSSAMMFIVPNTSRRIYNRRLQSGEFQPWGFLMASDDTVADSVWAVGTSSAPQTITPKALRVGGAAAARTVAIGDGQTWQDVRSSRTLNTWYQNTTGKTIAVALMVEATGSFGCFVRSGSDGNGIRVTQGSAEWQNHNFLVPPGHFYRVAISGGGQGIQYWSELR